MVGLGLVVLLAVCGWLFKTLKEQGVVIERLVLRVSELEKNGVAPSSQGAPPQEVGAPIDDVLPDVAAPSAENEHPLLPKRGKQPAAAAHSAGSVWVGKKMPKEVAPPSQAFVFKRENTDAVMDWLRDRWLYAVAALSFVLAGVFLIQYGVENGLLTPVWRVFGAIVLGGVLIAGGEYIRRKSGDEDGHAAYLPSTFSGAGVVVLFVAVVAARQMYGLIGVEMAFVGLCLACAVALVLGWFYGPMLSVVGVLGASSVPFLVGGGSDTPNFLFVYFAMISLIGLGIDTVKRWAWASVFSLILPAIGAFSAYTGGNGEGVYFLMFALVVGAAAIAIPRRSLRPTHDGPALSDLLYWAYKSHDETLKPMIEFPTRLALGAAIGASAAIGLVIVNDKSPLEVWGAFAALAALFLAAVYWLRAAPALRDLAFAAPVAFVGSVAVEGFMRGEIYQLFFAGLNRAPEVALPKGVYLLIAMGVAASLILFQRSLAEQRRRLVWSACAAFVAPATVVVLEAFWQPAIVLGETLWASLVMGVAGLMVLLAERTARVDGRDRRRAAFFAMAALVMISLAVILMLSNAALTVAIALLVLLAALLDHRFDMRFMTVFVQVGTIAVTYRSVIDPGAEWLVDRGGIGEIVLVAAVVLGLLAGAWHLLKARGRLAALIVTESAVWSLAAIFGSAILYRVMDEFDLLGDAGAFSLILLTVWISVANQLYRTQVDSRALRIMRLVLAWVFGVAGSLLVAVELIVLNPAWGVFAAYVSGVPIVNALIFSYALPAVLFAFIPWKMPYLRKPATMFYRSLAALFAVIFIGLEIRHLWWGADLNVNNGVLDGELYSYTVAMLLASGALLYHAISKRDARLRRMAMFGVGLTIVKVFAIDMAELSGLIRVLSFAGLGLPLAGLGWIMGNVQKSSWENDTSEEEPPAEG